MDFLSLRLVGAVGARINVKSSSFLLDQLEQWETGDAGLGHFNQIN